MDENYGFVVGEEDHQALDLPPGFRFHPTDEELITHYLSPKAIDSSFCARAIGEVDLNKCEPWDLPKWAKMGEKEWYFFCLRDRKYPTGLRTNRATEAGYWKATGKDKEIYQEKSLVGMKKTLVFYKGRAPKGQKSNWVMHEFRLEGRLSLQNLPSSSKNEWVISRIFHKNPGGKTHPFPGLIRTDPSEIEPDPTGLPPLMESSPCSTDVAGVRTSAHAPHVSCFSGSMLMDGSSSYRNDEEEAFDSYINYNAFNPVGASNSAYMNMKSAFDYSGQNHILKSILENQREYEGKPHMANSGISQDTGLTGDTIKGEISSVRSEYQIERQPLDDDQVGPSISGGPIDLDVLWNF